MIATAVIGGGAALGSTPSAKTTGEITSGNASEFDAVVKSKQAKCVKNRKVLLLYRNTARGGGGVKVGSARSDKHGMVVFLPDGTFYAGDYALKIPKVDVQVNGDPLTCKAFIGTYASF